MLIVGDLERDAFAHLVLTADGTVTEADVTSPPWSRGVARNNGGIGTLRVRDLAGS